MELEPAGGFVFPEGYAARGYTRERLSKLEQGYFDDLEESKDAGKAQAVLDKMDLCHQAGITGYDDVTAFVEGRVTFEELVKDQAEMAEVRRKQCEQQQQREERRSGKQAVALELPGEGLACCVVAVCLLIVSGRACSEMGLVAALFGACHYPPPAASYLLCCT